jgi:predicted nucleic acid binding AN1-type Zn finger protein
MKNAALYGEIATGANVKPVVVARVLKSLRDKIARDVLKTGRLRVPELVNFRLRDIPSRERSVKKMFGKDVVIAAKPASKKLCVTPSKLIKNVLNC